MLALTCLSKESRFGELDFANLLYSSQHSSNLAELLIPIIVLIERHDFVSRVSSGLRCAPFGNNGFADPRGKYFIPLAIGMAAVIDIERFCHVLINPCQVRKSELVLK